MENDIAMTKKEKTKKRKKIKYENKYKINLNLIILKKLYLFKMIINLNFMIKIM